METASGVQTKAKQAICSSVGDIYRHEKMKKLSKEKRIEILQETYDKYGARSNEFFTQVKPFIMWTVYRHLRGMPAAVYLEDLVNTAYEDLIIAFEGGTTSYYNRIVHREPTYLNDEYYLKYNNIGDFVMGVVGSSVSRFRSKHFRRQVAHEDGTEDISERVNFTDFEERYKLNYELEEPEYVNYFSYFKPDIAFLKHLNLLQITKPKNNILYNFMLWQEKPTV